MDAVLRTVVANSCADFRRAFCSGEREKSIMVK